MIRPELVAAAWRRRELLAGLACAALGVLIAAQAYGVLRWLGGAAVLLGAALVVLGWQRLPLRPTDERLGVIEVDEAQIAYWGPLSGGAVARDALTSVSIDHRNSPPTWVLAHEEGADLHIPVSARGQDALVDALAGLPGLNMQALTAAHGGKPGTLVLVWRRVQAVDTALASPHL